MCGIAGFAGRGDEADLRAMTGALAHRGPDAQGIWWDADEAVGLGHRRLAVVDLECGDQPMWTADGKLGVVFNGEIYNHRELRAALVQRGHRFRTDHSDTEVLLHGWREWGERMVERLNGMWAFALYDRGARRLFLSRDRFGVKPLYWARTGDTTVFASELSALLRHRAAAPGLSEAGLRRYFAYGYIPAPHTICRGVWKLPAGANLVVPAGGGEPRMTRWWEFSIEAEDPPDERVDAWTEELRERLERAVARRLLADVPVGIFLSGGIDSSAVTAVAARRVKPGELRTFSIGFEEESFDESRHARSVARAFGARHRAALFTARRAAEAWPRLAARLDEPLADPSLLPTWVLAGLAREDVTVALGGDGADELFAGYDPFRALRWASLYAAAVPRGLHRAVALLAARLPTSHRYQSFDFRLKRALAGVSAPPQLWNPLWLAPLPPAELAELLAEPVDPEEVYAEAIEAWERGGARTLVDRTLQFYTRIYLQDDILTKVDRASMWHGLEVRSPFLDVELVDLVRRMPARWKLRGGRTKWILRRAVAPWLPAEVLRRRKQGFGVPVGRWLQQARPPFDGDAGSAFRRRRLAEHRGGRADHRLYLYAEWALERFRDGAGAGLVA